MAKKQNTAQETAKDVKNKEVTVVRETLPPLASIELKVTNY